MRKPLLLAIVMLFAGAMSAQNEMAILSHSGTLTDYYGTTALADALSAAVSGDVVTVSSGSFNITSIPEGVTVRGAGFEEDLEAGGIMPTIVDYPNSSGSLIINKKAKVEGIKFVDNVKVCDSVYLSKCYFGNSLYPYRNVNGNDHYDATNLTIVNCYISTIQNNNMKNSIITNSIISDYGKTSPNGGLTQVKNCIIGDISYDILNTTTTPDVFTGCILITNTNCSSQRKQTNCYNCIGLYCSEGAPFFAASGDTAINYTAFLQLTQAQQDSVLALTYTNSAHHNFNANSFAELFNFLTYVTAAPRTDYSLTPTFDTLALQYGIGLFQGMAPYTPFVNRPHYLRTNVSPRTTNDGQLSVDIQVVTVEE